MVSASILREERNTLKVCLGATMTFLLQKTLFYGTPNVNTALNGFELMETCPEEVQLARLEENTMQTCCNYHMSLALFGKLEDHFYLKEIK